MPAQLPAQFTEERGQREEREDNEKRDFLDPEGSVSGVAAFQPREQLRYNGVRKVRMVRTVRSR